jgi:hypothetical protein
VGGRGLTMLICYQGIKSCIFGFKLESSLRTPNILSCQNIVIKKLKIFSTNCAGRNKLIFFCPCHFLQAKQFEFMDSAFRLSCGLCDNVFLHSRECKESHCQNIYTMCEWRNVVEKCNKRKLFIVALPRRHTFEQRLCFRVNKTFCDNGSHVDF